MKGVMFALVDVIMVLFLLVVLFFGAAGVYGAFKLAKSISVHQNTCACKGVS